jgi:hypothetical protein
MTGTQVAADWAWISKDPDAGIGYGVLDTSRTNVDFGPFIGRFVPGSPSSTASPDAPDAPPWITFGPVVVGPDETLTTVSVREPWHERDHAGRPVWPQKLFVIRFAELAQAGASYQTIARVAFGTEIPARQHATLRLEIGAQPLDELIQIINFYGFEPLAAIAAAVLEGPVVVAGAGHLGRGERLAVLDAVAALLPYGFRAGLSVSSVVDNTSKHGIRLTFADFVNDGQRLVPLQGPAPGPRTDEGRHYLETLGKKEITPGLGTLIRHMWDARGPSTFDKPAMAAVVLADLDFYGAFRREASKGPVPPAMLRKFLSDPAAAQRAWAGFDTRIRDNAIASYLPGCRAEAAEVVIPCWSFLGHDVIRLINHALDDGNLDFALWCLRTAGVVEDRLLGELLVPEEEADMLAAGRGARRRRNVTLVEMLRQRDAPQPDGFRYTCDQLRFGDATGWQARLVLELLIRELATERAADRGRAWAWVWWLCESKFTTKRQRPAWVEALDFVVFTPPPEKAAASTRPLILGDVSWAAVLSRLASQSQCLRDLLGQADQEFVGLASRIPEPVQPGTAAAQLRAELNRGLWPLEVRPGAVASIDVVRVLLGDEPRDFPDELPDKALDGYFDGLGSALRLEAVQSRLGAIEGGFLQHAVPGQAPQGLTAGGVRLLNAWVTDQRLMPGLRDYIANLDPSAYPYHEGLSRAFWDALRQHPALAGYAAGNQLIIAVKEALRDPRNAFLRPLTEDGVQSTRLARACFDARCAGLSVEGIVGALARAEAGRIGAEHLDDVLGEFQELLNHGYPDGSRAQQAAEQKPAGSSAEDLSECYRLILTGALGGLFAEEFGRHLEGRLKSEIHASQWVLKNVVAAARKKQGRLSRLLRWRPRRRDRRSEEIT